MSSYIYELPTTGSIVFSDILVDETGQFTHNIANATLARSNLRGALKESKRTDEAEKDHLSIIKVGIYAIMKRFTEGWPGGGGVFTPSLRHYRMCGIWRPSVTSENGCVILFSGILCSD
jgi:hypothetical protein